MDGEPCHAVARDSRFGDAWPAIAVMVDAGARLPLSDLTELIAAARRGDPSALPGLFTALYPELRRIAHARLTRNSRHETLGTTALVHECFLKFTAAARVQPEDRDQFLMYAATAMRSIVVDFARARGAERRGGNAPHVPLDSALIDATPEGAQEILRVHEALEQLSALDGRLVQVVEMRYFAGMTEAEIGAALGIAERTVRRDWEKARLLLAAAISPA